ncbi:MAG: GNAT family N-acetyltransferase [Candidatus Marinimicrobia bacterium]|jgi:GNAT superfamily N-acetyltransferase|nr:GNAT family N-acetyltransferase [Candidatus Neomarinimicrobiota bacterium]MBT3575923.1 GNAT family N-acetyltransferase [Candidatus Neomarinimicrobiota bacterium]MBT3679380.1 GNAT family N-acetyltransferase [Candidatus Neomarinimicrobiota bacterium]MBT3951151.1 GNAT family N-acetyltransferase [Candidatus Neomarinimicrobiota bacterium]MBT4254169.1 GNAT family N-acetyltransferase [Candidatus Neomarinimicrobiota bacterium]
MKLSPQLQTEMDSRNLKFIQACDMDGFVDAADVVTVPSWPEFMHHDPVANNWYSMHEKYPEFQFALIETETEKWIAVGNSIPLHFDGALEDLPDAGWDWAMLTGINADKPANLFSALAIQILPDYRGGGLSTIMIKVMQEIGLSHGLTKLIAPVRPNKKSDYPLIPMETYIEWAKDDLPFDPWLRVHHRLGARILKVCPEAMCIPGTIKSWEEWTGLSFQSSGDYIVPGALSPVKIDFENDRGVYIEANVWMLHDYDKKERKRI